MRIKGELSINMLIIVALALLILIILVVLLGKGSKSLDTGLDCVQKGGKCTSEPCQPGAYINAQCPQDSYTQNNCCRLVS